MSTVQITGGGFQDILGNSISSGILTFEINQDAVVGDVQVCSEDIISVSLNSDGDVSGTQTIWPNDQLTPSTTYYKVTLYSSDGALVWGPNNLYVLSTPSPFNLTDWTPLNPA